MYLNIPYHISFYTNVICLNTHQTNKNFSKSKSNLIISIKAKNIFNYIFWILRILNFLFNILILNHYK